MRYINQLESENADMKQRIESAQQTLQQLRGYYASNRFALDPRVNRSEVLKLIDTVSATLG